MQRWTSSRTSSSNALVVQTSMQFTGIHSVVKPADRWNSMLKLHIHPKHNQARALIQQTSMGVQKSHDCLHIFAQ